MLEGPTEYVNARWMWSLHGFLRGIEWIMFHGHLDYFQKPPLGGRPNTKPGDHGTPNTHNRWFILCYHVWRPTWIEIHWDSIWLRADHIWLHTTLESPWPHYMILEVCWDGLWTLSFGLSQFHDRALGSRLWSGPKSQVTNGKKDDHCLVGLGVKAMVAGGNVWHVVSGEESRKVHGNNHACSFFIWLCVATSMALEFRPCLVYVHILCVVLGVFVCKSWRGCEGDEVIVCKLCANEEFMFGVRRNCSHWSSRGGRCF